MKYFKQLIAIPAIISAELIDLTDRLVFVTDKVLRKDIARQLLAVEVYRLVYKVGKLRVVGYVAIPKTGMNLPCLIHLRGGSTDFGMIKPRTIIGQMVNYAAAGYVVITTQYPGVEGGDGSDTFGGLDDMASIKKLRDILAALPMVDVKNIGVKGHSRGGLMIYMLLREVRWIKAAMIAGAPTDQVDRTGDRPGWREHQKEMWGGSKIESIKRSPIRWVDALPKRVPLLIMHGSADWRVLVRHSLVMVTALVVRQIPHRFILFEGADHGITEYRAEYHRQTLDWFNRFLVQHEPLPNMKPHGE